MGTAQPQCNRRAMQYASGGMVLDDVNSDKVKYEAHWMETIVRDDAEWARVLLDDRLDRVHDISLTRVMEQYSDAEERSQAQHTVAGTTYAPDNVWCLAAVFNARNVMRVLVEQQVSATERTRHGNNYLHCLIAFASLENEEVECDILSSAEYIRSLLSDQDYTKILLAENYQGLRPLELASHLGTMILFRHIFESRLVYMTLVRDMGIYVRQYYDITEYVKGSRLFKSPPCTMMLLEEKRLGYKSVHDVFLTDPIKTWFASIMFTNLPYIVIWSLLRITFLVAFFCAMLLTICLKYVAEEDSGFNETQMNISARKDSPGGCYDNADAILNVMTTTMVPLTWYACLFSACAILHDIILCIIMLVRFGRWHFKTVHGTKCLVLYNKFYLLAEASTLIGALVVGQGMLNSFVTHNFDVSLLQYIGPMVIIAVCACVWNILYFLQLVPGLNLYVVAIQRMLDDFVNFAVVFGLFFLCYSFGFGILNNKTTNMWDIVYTTFETMLNITNYENATITIQFLHVAFIFMIVYLLLNILIAIFASAYEHVTKNKAVIMRIQTLTVAFRTEYFGKTFLTPLHNRLRRKHLVFKGDKVYVTKIVMKTRHRYK